MAIPFGVYELLRKHKSLIVEQRPSTDQLQEVISPVLSKKCLMFGRAKMTLSPEQIDQVSSRDGIPKELLTGWADGFLQNFGFDWVRSLDYSDFEGAGFTWNLNKPLINSDKKMSELFSSVDLILDNGTSEHVFNPGMSFCNATTLLKKGGHLNAYLPVCGWCDHGIYQFSPSFFYAVDRAEFKLEALYFFVRSTQAGKLTLWDGLSSEFREHVHGAFDGSFAANCLQSLNEPIVAWALFRKVSEVNPVDFMHNTQQLIYKKQWSGTRCTIRSNSVLKLEMYHLEGLARERRFVEYINSIALDIDQLAVP